MFDDLDAIINNPTIRHGLSRAALFPPGGGTTVMGRPVLNLSFAANYALGGLNPAGYHGVNVAIHLAAALALFGIVRRTLWRLGSSIPGPASAGVVAPALGAQPGPRHAALLVAVLWAVHPLQTESVTYVAQRAESLMGLFYLLTFYAFIRGWYPVAVGACLLGMGTKEVMVSAPVMVLLYDRTFLSASWREVLAKRGRWHAALFATWLWLAYLVLAAHGRGGTSGFGVSVSWARYFGAQLLGLGRYVRLATWPDPLVFDYGNRYLRSWTEAVPGAVVLAGLLTLAVRWLRRPSVAGFLAIGFLAILAPTSLIPGFRQTMAEHRMYLALGFFVIGLVALASRFMGRWAVALWILAVPLTAATAARNRVYRTSLGLWEATIAACPENYFAWTNAGVAWFQDRNFAEAIRCYRQAAELNPAYPDAHNNWGNALLQQGDVAGAEGQFAEAVRLDPQFAAAHANHGVALAALGRTAEAQQEIRRAVELAPEEASSHTNEGKMLSLLGDRPGALREYARAMELAPEAASAHYDVANAASATGDLARAVAEYRAALRLDPNYADAYNNLGIALERQGRMGEALPNLEAGVRLAPRNAHYRVNLAIGLVQVGRRAEAVEQLQLAIQLDPSDPHARTVLASLQR